MRARFVLALLAAFGLVFGAAAPAVAAGPETAVSTGVECLRCPL
ncbi:hypothetical protein SAMN05421810_102167 [Amycolatopsis arida]|uniref:Uncharacterized protein n=1 Tax=Amycolatopsis arida TaxID=587909 RepID=A0A1I5P7P6_9PSEU|nr:hypothetical protein CLV69_101167 [Amycolatopsis arida]SFP29486.1 hypothetical protein SAMN05421810_102167 [Amycolatopsis arida]